MSNVFAIGVAQLNSGSDRMTIEGIAPGEAYCVWFDSSNTVARNKFPPEALHQAPTAEEEKERRKKTASGLA